MAACSSGTVEESSKTGKDDTEEITLRMTWWGGQPRHDYTLELIKMFEKENPGVKIEPEYASWDDYWKKLAPMAAGNSLPDIIQMDGAYISQYGENGQLADLTPFIDDGTIDTSSINKDFLVSGKIDDKLYGFSFGATVMSVVSNDNLIDEAGVKIDDVNWTWDDFEEFAIQVHEKTGKYATNGMYPPDVFFPYYLRTKGELFYREDGKALGYEDDQLFVDYFSMQLRLVEAGAFPTPDVQSQLKGMEDEFIVKGDASVTWNWSNQYIGFSQLTENPLSLNLPPHGSESIFLNTGAFWSISKNSEHKELAAKFIDFYTNNKEANKIIKGERGVPLSSEVVEGMKDVLSETERRVFDFVEKAKGFAGPSEPPKPAGSAEVIKALKSISEEILFKAITPEEGAKKFRQQANEALGRDR
nr:sugar ABC transporter substrate-binding protein [Bacillus sinesaloumensis]